jgi:hypothetical protein
MRPSVEDSGRARYFEATPDAAPVRSAVRTVAAMRQIGIPVSWENKT